MDPAVVEFLAAVPDTSEPGESLLRQRASILRASDGLARRWTSRGPQGPRRETRRVPGPEGDPLRLRIYHPPSDVDPRGVHVFLHGGGFWLGSVDELVVDATCRERAATGCVVVAVDYRLAPDGRFPAAVEDAYTALGWAAEAATTWGAETGGLSVGGVSAGATLAAAAALAARDRGGPPLRLQLLEVPVLDLTLTTMRGSGVPDDYGMTVAEMELCTGYYVPDPADARHPLASPLLAPDLTGLPPAHVMTAELDPLRDDGARYVDRLRDAGVPAEHRRHPGMVHGAICLTRRFAGAVAWQDDVARTLRQAHRTTHPLARPADAVT